LPYVAKIITNKTMIGKVDGLYPLPQGLSNFDTATPKNKTNLYDLPPLPPSRLSVESTVFHVVPAHYQAA
jgi:hypothetical protein